MSMSHTQYARSLGIAPSVIVELIEDDSLDLFTVERKHAATYHLEHPLPAEAEVIAAARALYERRLRSALAATKRLQIEVEAVRNDLLEALEHGLDPVLPLGNDALSTGSSTNPRSPIDSTRTDLSYALMLVALAHDGLHDYDRSKRLAVEEG